MYKLTRGLSLPLQGAPIGDLANLKNIKHVAITADDFIGMKPSMFVKEGDSVLKGQKLFECKKVPGVIFTSPVSGTVKEINRGARRAFQNIIVENDFLENQIEFLNFDPSKNCESTSAENCFEKSDLIKLINEAGLWTSFRTRPFSKTPNLDSECSSIFVTAMDTNPLALNPDWIVSKRSSEFNEGLKALTLLTDGNIYLCKSYGSTIKGPTHDRIIEKEFDGPHPAGNVGTHIHFIDPVEENKTVWHIGYQDLISLGSLLLTGQLFTERIISLCGPACEKPMTILTRVGADINEIIDGYSLENVRVISGSVFNGRTCNDIFHFLGKFVNQVTMLNECVDREFMGWHNPGPEKFSVLNLFASKLIPFAKFNFNTSNNGSHRAIVPVGAFEKVMPLDLLPVPLLKMLLVNDTDAAIELGALELDEEDLALCSFVCNGKNDYAKALRQTLETIEKEG